MMKSRSEEVADTGLDYDLVGSLETACEGCDQRFVPVAGETMCRDCVHALFEPTVDRENDDR